MHQRDTSRRRIRARTNKQATNERTRRWRASSSPGHRKRRSGPRRRRRDLLISRDDHTARTHTEPLERPLASRVSCSAAHQRDRRECRHRPRQVRGRVPPPAAVTHAAHLCTDDRKIITHTHTHTNTQTNNSRTLRSNGGPHNAIKHAGTHVLFSTACAANHADSKTKTRTRPIREPASLVPQFNHTAPRTREHIHREHEQHVKRRPATIQSRGPAHP